MVYSTVASVCRAVQLASPSDRLGCLQHNRPGPLGRTHARASGLSAFTQQPQCHRECVCVLCDAIGCGASAGLAPGVPLGAPPSKATQQPHPTQCPIRALYTTCEMATIQDSRGRKALRALCWEEIANPWWEEWAPLFRKGACQRSSTTRTTVSCFAGTTGPLPPPWRTTSRHTGAFRKSALRMPTKHTLLCDPWGE